MAYLGASVMRTKHYPHPFLEDGPGVAPEEVGPIAPIPPEKFTLKPKRPQRSCLNRGAVAHHPLAGAASAAPLAHARARRVRHNG